MCGLCAVYSTYKGDYGISEYYPLTSYGPVTAPGTGSGNTQQYHKSPHKITEQYHEITLKYYNISSRYSKINYCSDYSGFKKNLYHYYLMYLFQNESINHAVYAYVHSI